MAQEQSSSSVQGEKALTWEEIYRLRCGVCGQKPRWDFDKTVSLDANEIWLFCGCKGKGRAVRFIPGSNPPGQHADILGFTNGKTLSSPMSKGSVK